VKWGNMVPPHSLSIVLLVPEADSVGFADSIGPVGWHNLWKVKGLFRKGPIAQD
jgi:hypothetical protein